MHEDRATASGHPRTGIVVDLDDEVVEVVAAPQPVAWFIGRAPERPIIAAVRGIFAPGNIAGNALRRQQSFGPRRPVRPPPQPPEPKPAPRRAAVALALVGADARAAE